MNFWKYQTLWFLILEHLVLLNSTGSDISDGDHTSLFLEGANSLEHDQGQIHPTGQIYMTDVGYVRSHPIVTPLEPSQGPDMSGQSDIFYEGRICPTRLGCHGFGT
jgi:hypothetical protein